MALQLKESIKSQANKIQANCQDKADAHFKAAKRWSSIHYLLGIPAVIIAGVTGVASFGKLFESNDIVVGTLAITVAALSALSTFLNPYEKANSHQVAANNYNTLKYKARTLENIELSLFESEQTLYEKLNGLYEELSNIGKNSPFIHGLSLKDMKIEYKKRGEKYKYQRK